MNQVHELRSIANIRPSLFNPRSSALINPKQLELPLKDFMLGYMQKTRQYASYQLKTARRMRIREPESYFGLDPTRMSIEHQADEIVNLYESHERAT